MYRFAHLLLISIMLSAGSMAVAQKNRFYMLSSSGFGPLKIGMTFENAAAVLGVKLIHDKSRASTKDCFFAIPEADYEGLSFMLEGDLVTRIDVSSNKINTLNGIKVGSSLEQMRRVYGRRVTVEPNAQVGFDGKTVTANVSSTNDIAYEVVGGKVVNFRSGLTASVAKKQGCK